MLMGNYSREDTMDLHLNQDPLDQSNYSGIDLDTIPDDLEIETAHGCIEDRIRQLEAVTTRATRRQRPRHDSGDDSAVVVQERIVHSGKISKKDGSRLVAEALRMNMEPNKTAGNKAGRFYDCNICLDAAKIPILTCCGHLFCWSCFSQLPYVHSNIKECPECQGEVEDTSIIPIYGHGISSDAKKSNHKDSGLKVPPRPRAQRIERTNMLGQRHSVTENENENNQQSRSLPVSRLLRQDSETFQTLSSALNSLMETLGEGLRTYIHNHSASRSLPQALPNNPPNNGDPLSGVAATVRSDRITPDPVGGSGITSLVPQFESSSTSMDIATNIEHLENQASSATEFDRLIILSSPSTRRRTD